MSRFLTSVQGRALEALERVETAGSRCLIVHESSLGLSTLARRFVADDKARRRMTILRDFIPIKDQLRSIIGHVERIWGSSADDQLGFAFSDAHSGRPRLDAGLIIVDNIHVLGSSDVLEKFVASLNDTVAPDASVGIALIGQFPFMCGRKAKEDGTQAVNCLTPRARDILGPVNKLLISDVTSDDVARIVGHFGGDTPTSDYVLNCFATAGLRVNFATLRRVTKLLSKHSDKRAIAPDEFVADVRGD